MSPPTDPDPETEIGIGIANTPAAAGAVAGAVVKFPPEESSSLSSATATTTGMRTFTSKKKGHPHPSPVSPASPPTPAAPAVPTTAVTVALEAAGEVGQVREESRRTQERSPSALVRHAMPKSCLRSVLSCIASSVDCQQERTGDKLYIAATTANAMNVFLRPTSMLPEHLVSTALRSIATPAAREGRQVNGDSRQRDHVHSFLKPGV